MVPKRQPLLLLLIFVRTTCVPRRLQGAYTQLKFTATDAAPESYFGAGVALDGDVLAVAATDVVWDDGGWAAPDSGSAYVIRTTDGQMTKLMTADGNDVQGASRPSTAAPSCSSPSTTTSAPTRARFTSSARLTAAPRMSRWPS